MAKYAESDPALFSAIEAQTRPFEAPGRTQSAALLLWFLETVYRLDDVEAQDAVCDRKGDAGFDAIIADDLRKEIVVLQAKRREKLPATLGDTDLKVFVGSLAQLTSEAAVKALAAKTENDDLKALLSDLDVGGKVEAGYRIRAIFVCNIAGNADARSYIEIARRDGHQLDVWDLARFGPVLKQLEREWFVAEEARLRIDPKKLFYYGDSKTAPTLVYAAVRAQELVALPGLEDSRIFAQNVRLGLGSTRVNDDILESVKNKSEHHEFLTFHNGITIVAKSIKLRGKTLKLQSFSVCNGCQSLLTFFNSSASLTDQLEVPVRIVRVGDDRRLPETIAYRTNNQNSISLRDLSSNDTTQVALKAEFDDLFGDQVVYAIKRGVTEPLPQLPNELAGRLLLALYNGLPWSAHQKYRIFGDLESQVFNYHVGAPHIRLVQLLSELVKDRLPNLENQRLARYGLTSFTLLYLLGELIRGSEDGKRFLNDPRSVLSTGKAPNPKQAAVLGQAGGMLDWLVTELNFYVRESGADGFDYKRQLKSPKAVGTIRDSLLKAFEKDVYRGRATKFALP